MHNSILVPPMIREKLKRRMKKCWSDEYQLRRYVCNFFEKYLCDLNEAEFGLTKEVAKTYFRATGSLPYEMEVDAACEELIKKYPDSLRKMFEDGMRKKLGMLTSALLGYMRVSEDRMCHHDILKELMDIRWDNPSNMIDVMAPIKALQIRLKYKINEMENFKREDSDYDGLIVVYPSAVMSRLESLSSIIQYVSPQYFKGVVAELEIISKCVIAPWRLNDPMKIRDYHEIASTWMTKIDMNDVKDGNRIVEVPVPVKEDIDPTVVIMTEAVHEAIERHSCLEDFLIMPGVQSLLRWLVLERFILNINLKEEEQEPDSECDCPIAVEDTTES